MHALLSAKELELKTEGKEEVISHETQIGPSQKSQATLE
jgi:hypothetical protein